MFPSFSQERFNEDDASLRETSLESVASLRNSSEYAFLHDLYVKIYQRFQAIDADAQAFANKNGGWDLGMLKAYTSLCHEVRAIIESLNKMKNSDRLVLMILETHTKKFAQNLAAPMGLELRGVCEELARIPEASHAAARLTALVEGGVTNLFKKAAVDSLAQSREKYNLS